MTHIDLVPTTKTSRIVLPATGNIAHVTSSLNRGIYSVSHDFISGAVDQVGFTYTMLAGNAVDIELSEAEVYNSYEEAVLEYGKIINMHQAKNVLSDFLGGTTGTFDHDGELKNGILSASLSGSNVSLKFPRFTFGYGRRIADGLSKEAFIGDNVRIYSASIQLKADTQEYDLQTIVASASTGNVPFAGKLNNKRIVVSKVYYKSPRSMWRFFGYHGGLSTVGNLHTYGQYADDSTFEIIPSWQHRLQAQAYENNLFVRASHYSYQLRDNFLKLYPVPSTASPANIWFEFIIEEDTWTEDDNKKSGIDGINNANTLPFTNIPFENINSIGKQWIRKFALAISKGILSQARGKYGDVPLPGDRVRLNFAELYQQSEKEKDSLRDELKKWLDELTYSKMVAADADLAENAARINKYVPSLIFVG
jgi:hypothetical protein